MKLLSEFQLTVSVLRLETVHHFGEAESLFNGQQIIHYKSDIFNHVRMRFTDLGIDKPDLMTPHHHHHWFFVI